MDPLQEQWELLTTEHLSCPPPDVFENFLAVPIPFLSSHVFYNQLIFGVLLGSVLNLYIYLNETDIFYGIESSFDEQSIFLYLRRISLLPLKNYLFSHNNSFLEILFIIIFKPFLAIITLHHCGGFDELTFELFGKN